MNKLCKKILSSSLAGMLLLAGCANNTAESQSAPSQPDSVSTSAQVTQEQSTQQSNQKTVIEYWHVNAETQGGRAIAYGKQ